MDGKNHTSGPIDPFTVFKYVGPGYVNAVPARDLTAADLLELRERECITRQQIEASGIYEAVELSEVAPFCGAELGDGRRCRRKVSRWGMRCYQHLPDEEVEE
jgi:hypothetical protein